MAKRKSKTDLLSRLEAMPDKDEKRGTSWEEELAAVAPDVHEELLEVIDLWFANDPLVRRKIASKSALARFVSSILDEHGVERAQNTLRHTMSQRGTDGQP